MRKIATFSVLILLMAVQPAIAQLSYADRLYEENSFEDDESLFDPHATIVPAGFVQKTSANGLIQYEGVISKEAYKNINANNIEDSPYDPI